MSAAPNLPPGRAASARPAVPPRCPLSAVPTSGPAPTALSPGGRVVTARPDRSRPLRLVVLSPHLDDAVFSVGATVAALAAAGADITVATVFAGDPEAHDLLTVADARAGFRTSALAATLRRQEDLRACELVGATPRWFDLVGGLENRATDDEVAAAVVDATRGADLVLVPGFPLTHPDHRRVAEAVDRNTDPARHALFLEQPYASWLSLSRRNVRPAGGRRGRGRGGWVPPSGLAALRTPFDPTHYRRKLLAMTCYGSQLRILRRLPRTRIVAHELWGGGELVAWPERDRAEVSAALAGGARSGRAGAEVRA